MDGILEIRAFWGKGSILESWYGCVSHCECSQEQKNQAQRLACRFAAKEALFKALGTGWRVGIRWKDVEVTNDDLGKPIITLSGEAKQLSRQLGVSNIFVSMTNTKDYGAAQVILTSQ